jgi:hypothetical protein
MTKMRKLGLSLSVVMLGLLAMGVGERFSVPGISGYVATAEARVGRPLTPVSVAGQLAGRPAAAPLAFTTAERRAPEDPTPRSKLRSRASAISHGGAAFRLLGCLFDCGRRGWGGIWSCLT